MMVVQQPALPRLITRYLLEVVHDILGVTEITFATAKQQMRARESTRKRTRQGIHQRTHQRPPPISRNYTHKDGHLMTSNG